MLIPMIRNLLPSIIAKDLVSVQPMTNPCKELFWNFSCDFQYYFLPKSDRVLILPNRGKVCDCINAIPGILYDDGKFTVGEEVLTLLLLQFEGQQVWDTR